MRKTKLKCLEDIARNDYMLYNFALQVWQLITLTLLTSWKVIKITNLVLLVLVNLVIIQFKKILGLYNGSE